MTDFETLDHIGLNQYERLALIGLMERGVADAATLCEDGDIPSSKIYLATEKLAKLGLISVQSSRPRIFAALSPEAVVDRLGEIARERAERFVRESRRLLDVVEAAKLNVVATKTFADLALGADAHVRRHIAHLAAAKKSIVSYMERADLDSLDAAKSRTPVLRRIRRNVESNAVQHRAVFGFSHRDAPRLLQFLKDNRQELRAMTGIRYAGLLGHPFHVVDDELVILNLDNAFLPERRFASVLIQNKELAGALTAGFEGLWAKAMKNLQEINFHPDVLLAHG